MFERFKICSFDKNQEIIADKCAPYLSYVNYKGLGTPIDTGKGRSLLIDFVEKKYIGLGKGDRDFIVSCKDINYDFIIYKSNNESKNAKFKSQKRKQAALSF